MLNIFKLKKPNIEKLRRYGFAEADGVFTYEEVLDEVQMRLSVTVSGDGVETQMTDCLTGEEYVLYKVAEAQGAFVGQVREACRQALERIADGCFDGAVFRVPQTERVIARCREAYGTQTEFPWADSPCFAVLRRSDTQKWYGVIMRLPLRRIGIDEEGETEVINLHVPPEDVAELVDRRRFFPAYHMNKKHWLTVRLGGETSDGEVFALLEKSYRLAGKK